MPANDPIDRLLTGVILPPVQAVTQTFPAPELPDPAATLAADLRARLPADLRGRRIAVACGSRGIDRLALLVRIAAACLRERGAEPFIVPAMGSHGGATAAGQTALLAGLGVTEASVRAPICSDMAVCEIGRTADGEPVLIDRLSCSADGIVLLNRIKPHTSFRGPYESGLIKMLTIGLGKQAGAERVHSLRYERMADHLVQAGRVALGALQIVCAIGILENSYGRIAELHVLASGEILDREPELLRKARTYQPRLYLDEIDVLIVGEIGKEISGTGMDTNIVGRFHTAAASGGPRTTKLGLLDLSAQAGGNANGMGLADFVTRRLADKIDYTATYLNTLTSTEPNSSRLPMVLDHDRQVLQACVKLCGRRDPAQVRLIVIRNTKQLGQVFYSPAALSAACCCDRLQVTEACRSLPFDRAGNLTLFAPDPDKELGHA
jgi:hypothetical protein